MNSAGGRPIPVDPVEYVRVYLHRGTVHHLIDVDRLGTTRERSTARALCGQLPDWSSHWQGTGVGEFEKAAALRVCKQCHDWQERTV